MSLDKGIKYGKEKRKQYRKSALVDRSCRNGGSCPYCQRNRMYQVNKAKEKAQYECDYYRDEGWE